MKDAVLTVRVPRHTRERIEQLAREQGRSLSQQVERLLDQALSDGERAASDRARPLAKLSGMFADDLVPTLEDFRDVRAALSAALERRASEHGPADR